MTDGNEIKPIPATISEQMKNHVDWMEALKELTKAEFGSCLSLKFNA